MVYLYSKYPFKEIIVIIMATRILDLVGVTIVAFMASVIEYLLAVDEYNDSLLLFSYLLRLVLLYILYILEKKFHISELTKRGHSQYIIIIVGVVYQFIGIIMQLYNGTSRDLLPVITMTILVIFTLFGTLWVIDWYLSERERRKLWEDNNRMSQRLHKSKEIIPALNSALSQLKLNSDSRELDDILEEIHQFCQEQMGENELLDKQCKVFPPTGLHLLDEQIQSFEREAVARGINFDVFVGVPIKNVLKERRIRETDFLTLMGDLMRNAFRAIDRGGKEQGNILLVMGCIGDILQVDIYDDGAPFPMFILNEFGKRGNTVGGTGNGIADIMEFLEKHKATFRITEYQENATYTKGISIIWDGENGRWFDSHRSAELDGASLLLPEKL